ncbi:hypothetical protein GW750_04145 [bacterium]|nr:hypothetical protein [bacterium]
MSIRLTVAVRYEVFQAISANANANSQFHVKTYVLSQELFFIVIDSDSLISETTTFSAVGCVVLYWRFA